jgi:LuxR family transcriptional regulator, maltose regulon positive regulatory protein
MRNPRCHVPGEIARTSSRNTVDDAVQVGSGSGRPDARLTLAATKFLTPEPPVGAVTRPRLLDALDASAAAGVLTLIVGAPGSGKTVLLSAWARRTELRTAWLTLEAADADPLRFWEGVSQALRSAGVRGMRRGGTRPGSCSPADEIINAVARADAPAVLVLDDFHHVAAAVSEGIEHLLERAPRALHVIIATRRDPVMRLGRLRLAGRAHELRGRDLACTLEETRALLEAVGVQLPDATTNLLWERTEGWAAALRLAATALREDADPVGRVQRLSGEDTVISEYLVSELLSQQSDVIHDFLLRTSVVDVLDGHLAEVLTGRPGGRDTLLELARVGLLVSVLDGHARWFRYHGLFAELLRAELRWRDPALVLELHAIAANWFAEHGDEVAAVHHAIAGRSWGFAGRLAGDRWMDLLSRGELGVLKPLAEAVPPAEYEQVPELALAIAATRLDSGDAVRGRVALKAVKLCNDDSVAPDSNLAVRRAMVDLMLSRVGGDREHAHDAAREALEVDDRQGPAGDPALRSLVFSNVGMVETWSGDPEEGLRQLRGGLAAASDADSPWLMFLALAHLAVCEGRLGDLAAARRRADEALDMAETHGWSRTPAAGAAYVVLAGIACDQCRFNEAAALLVRAEAALAYGADRPVRAALGIAKVTMLSSLNRAGEGLDVLSAAVDALGEWPVDRALRATLIAWRGWLLAGTGQRAAAVSLLRGAADSQAVPVLAMLARLHIADGEFAEARLTVSSIVAADHSRGPALVDVWLVEALALDGLLEHQAAAAALERALDQAEPTGSVRAIVANAGAILPLLHRQQRLGTAHPALLEHAIGMIEQRAPIPRRSPAILEPLSDRERQVLGYMPTTMTNQEIASALFVSVNTVKTHLRAIYRKLDVDTRRDAVRRAREVRLIGSW